MVSLRNRQKCDLITCDLRNCIITSSINLIKYRWMVFSQNWHFDFGNLWSWCSYYSGKYIDYNWQQSKTLDTPLRCFYIFGIYKNYCQCRMLAQNKATSGDMRTIQVYSLFLTCNDLIPQQDWHLCIGSKVQTWSTWHLDCYKVTHLCMWQWLQ